MRVLQVQSNIYNQQFYGLKKSNKVDFKRKFYEFNNWLHKPASPALRSFILAACIAAQCLMAFTLSKYLKMLNNLSNNNYSNETLQNDTISDNNDNSCVFADSLKDINNSVVNPTK